MHPALKIGTVAALVVAGLLGLGLTGKGPDTERQAGEAAALRDQLAELRGAHTALQSQFGQFRDQAARLDETLGRVREELTGTDQAFKTALGDKRVAEDALSIARKQLEDQEAELARLRREIVLMHGKATGTRHEALAEGGRGEDGTNGVAGQSGPLSVQSTAPSPAVPATSVTASSFNGQPASSLAASSPAAYTTTATTPLRVPVLNLSADLRVTAIGYGRRQGAQERQRVVLSIEGRDCATVVLTAVRADFSVGMLLPGGFPEQLHTGTAPTLRVVEP